jgi:hypothetical protein
MPRGWWKLPLVAVLVLLIPAAFFLGKHTGEPARYAVDADEWMPLVVDGECVTYDDSAFPTPPSVLLPNGAECSGRFRVLERSDPAIGFEFVIEIPAANPEAIPEAWRQDRVVGEWVYEAETQIPYVGNIEFVFLDEHGFEVTSLQSEEVQVRSGQTNEVRAVLVGLDQGDLQTIRSAKVQLLMTRCFLCSPPQE